MTDTSISSATSAITARDLGHNVLRTLFDAQTYRVWPPVPFQNAVLDLLLAAVQAAPSQDEAIQAFEDAPGLIGDDILALLEGVDLGAGSRATIVSIICPDFQVQSLFLAAALTQLNVPCYWFGDGLYVALGRDDLRFLPLAPPAEDEPSFYDFADAGPLRTREQVRAQISKERVDQDEFLKRVDGLGVPEAA